MSRHTVVNQFRKPITFQYLWFLLDGSPTSVHSTLKLNETAVPDDLRETDEN